MLNEVAATMDEGMVAAFCDDVKIVAPAAKAIAAYNKLRDLASTKHKLSARANLFQWATPCRQHSSSSRA